MIEVPSNNLSKDVMYPRYVDWKVYKYATGDTIPTGSIYMYSTKNGLMTDQSEVRNAVTKGPLGPIETPLLREAGYEFVWHYFLTPVIKNA